MLRKMLMVSIFMVTQFVLTILSPSVRTVLLLGFIWVSKGAMEDLGHLVVVDVNRTEADDQDRVLMVDPTVIVPHLLTAGVHHLLTLEDDHVLEDLLLVIDLQFNTLTDQVLYNKTSPKTRRIYLEITTATLKYK